MFRRLIGALFVVVIGVGITMAAELRGTITKVEDGKITFAERKGKGETSPAKVYTLAENVKVMKGKFDKNTMKVEADGALEGGLKNAAFTKISDKGFGATIITDANDKVTEIRVSGERKKKGK